jgi:hypothetical protein
VKKILFMTLAAILVLSVALVGCGGGGGGAVAPSAIKIGLVRDTDGVLQFYDQTSGGPVYRAINKTINDAGGIFMSTYNKSLPLELIIREYDPMTPAELGSQTIASITVDKVHFMWGAPGTGTIYVQAPICDAYGMLLMTLEGGATDMMSVPGKLDSWANTFINLSFSDWYQIPVMYKMLKEHVAAPRAYVLYIDNEHGAEYLNVTKQIFGAGNVTAEGHHQYIATQSDIDTIVTNAISALNTTGFEVFCAYTYDPYLSWTVASMDAYDFDPPAILMGPGAESGAYLYQFGGNLTGVCGFAVANNKSSVAPESVTMSFSAMWSLTMPQNSDPALPDKYCWTPWGQPPMFAGLEMFAEAVKQVGHLGVGYTAAVRSVLVGFNSTNPCTTVLGDTWYHVLGGGLGGGVIDYQCMPAQICQWQNNYTEIVGYTNITNDIPKYDVTSSFWYPMTGNWTWLP